MQRKWAIADEAVLKSCIDAVLTRLDEQGDAPYGRIAAEELIEIVAGYVGPNAYNHGLDDAKTAASTAAADLEIDIDSLRQSYM